MFERFTESARQVVVLAQEEARKLKHGYIGTEHLLLGLIRENGRATTTLRAHDVELQPARDWVVENVGEGDEEPPAGQLPVTPRMKKIFQLALEDAQALGHNAIGTQHLLIALLHEGQGAALQCTACARRAARGRLGLGVPAARGRPAAVRPGRIAEPCTAPRAP